MIKRKTVFVLGAGAHQPYGFPGGAGLIDQILTTIPAELDPRVDLGDISSGIYANQPNVSLIALEQFRVALEMGGHTSIDSFLATHSKRDGFSTIGKLAVAHKLLPLEFAQEWGRKPIKGDWMTYLFQSMLHGCLESPDKFIEHNHVSFVTFNYDRTLEDFLCSRISHTYTLQPAHAWEKTKQITIVHVYGSLGEFDPKVITPQFRPERAYMSVDQTRNAASSIRMMYDDRKGHTEVQRAMELIGASDCVCFLGFGFDPDNIERLELNSVCTRASRTGHVFATRFETRSGDWNRIVNNMAPTSLNSHFDNNSVTWDCLDFLHETAALG